MKIKDYNCEKYDNLREHWYENSYESLGDQLDDFYMNI